MINLVHVDRCVFERNTSGTVSVGIWLNFQGTAFPGDGWDDFAANILAAAIQAILRLARRESEAEEVYFMEGPFLLKLESLDGAGIQISAIQGRGETRTVHHQSVSAISLASDLCDASEQLLAWCGSVGWMGSDEVRLGQYVSELRLEILSRTN